MTSSKHKHNISSHTNNSSNQVEDTKPRFTISSGIMEDGGTGRESTNNNNNRK